MAEDVRSDYMGVRVLVVEDDERVSDLIGHVLTRVGLGFDLAGNGDEARRAFRTGGLDLVLLDLDLPDADGLDLLAELRETADTPVVIVSERCSLSDRVLGFRMGADDYVVKPFQALELLARVRAVLRRSGRMTPASPVVHGDLTIDSSSRQVFLDGDEVELTRLEFDLLHTLACHPRRAFSRETLLREVWGASPEYLGVDTVTEHVRRLRHKLGHRPGRPSVVTVRGVGYRFEPEQRSPGYTARSSTGLALLKIC